MSVTEQLMGLGSWQLQLDPSVPRSALNYLSPSSYAFGLIIVTPVRVKATDYSAATLRSIARYIGVYRERSDDYTIGGPGLAMLLGDEDNKGEILSTAVANTSAATLSTWINAILPRNGVAVGTVTNTGTSYSGSFQYVDPRSAIQAICDGTNAEWRVKANTSGTIVLDAAVPGTLFTNYTTPTVIITRKSSGRDPNVTGLNATKLSTAIDMADYTNKVYLVARGDGGATVGTATAGAIPYYNPTGGATLKLERVIDSSETKAGNETTVATLMLNRFNLTKRSIELSTDEYDVSGKVVAGERVYVYDPDIDVYDTANPVVYRGETLFPAILRCYGHTWSIRQGMGVYFQTPESSQQIIDLSDYFIPEEGDATLVVGSTTRPIGGSVNLDKGEPFGDVPKAVAADAWVSYTPTYTNFTLGNGTVDAAYYRIGRYVTFRGIITFGTTSSVSGTIQIALPVAAKASTWCEGTVAGEDASGGSARTIGCAEIHTAVWTGGLAFTSTGNSGWNATTPFTWATSDVLRWTITYEAAAS